MAELDPVEIDINMRQNVSEESARASQGIEDLAKSSQAAIDAMQKDIERLNGVVDNMNAIIAEQKKQMSGNNEVYGENIKRLEEMEAELNRTKAALSSYTDTSRQMIEASKEGANVTDIITDAQKNLANTETALSGSMGELMDNQKKINGSLDEGTKKVEINSASNKVLSVAIQSTCEALGIENTLITRSISNVGLIAGAKRGWANAVSLLNKELGFSLVASKALVAGGILTGLAAVAALGYGVKYLIDRYKEKTKEMREMREINRQVNTEYSVQASKVKILANEINNENISLELRKKRLNELRAIIPEYHADLNKEGKLINDNKQAIDAYLESLKEEIRLKSQRERLEKLYEKKTLIEEELDDVNDYVKNNKNAQPVIMQSSAGAVIQDSSASLALAENVKRQRELAKEQDDINNQIDKMEKRFNENLENNKSEQEKITRDNLDNRQKYIDGLRDTLKRLEIDSPEYLKVQAELIQKEKELSKITDKNSYKAIDKAEAKAETAAQKLLKQQQTAADKLEKGSVEYQKRIDAARIATMQSGADKERAAIQTEYDQTKDYIMRQLKEIAKLEAITGQPATTQRAELKELDKVAEARYRAETARVNAEAEKAINEIFADVNQKFQSDLDNNLSSINRYYDDIIKKAKLEGATLAQVNELNAKREKETIQARINNRLSQIDFDQEVATRRMEIADKVYLFEADREKDLLSIQLEAAEKRRNALQDGYNNMPTDELAKSLKLAGLEVDNLN
ncbi:MAG: hypothetical protein LBU84_06440, partial [Prevotella sp.]|nr:hypothetical protein [Prevotella sp.]